MSQFSDRDRNAPRPMASLAGLARPMIHLPRAVGVLFDTASRAGVRVSEGKQQVMLFSSAGTRLGGWNKASEHWYVSAVVAEGHEALLRQHGFEFKDRTADKHRWWQLGGPDGADGFRRVCEALTGDRIRSG